MTHTAQGDMSDSHLFISHGPEGKALVDLGRSTKSAVKSHVRTNKIKELQASRRACVQFNILTPDVYQKKRARKDAQHAGQSTCQELSSCNC